MSSLLRITFAALQKPCQGNFWKFQGSGQSRFGGSEKDRYFLKIPKWQHKLVRNYKRGKLVSNFLNNGLKTWLYGPKTSENIKIEHVFQFKAFFHISSNLHTSCFSPFKRLQVLATKVFKTTNDINPSYMKNIFVSKANAKVCPNDIEVRYHESTSYGDESLNILDLKIWNHHPSNIQSETSSINFEEYINTWLAPKCKCSIGKMIDFSHDFSYCYHFYMCLLYNFYTTSNFIVYFYSEFVHFVRFSLFFNF